MSWSVFYGILIPFLGTSFGAACVFFMKKEMGDRLQRMLTGFAAGVMVAASIWSLLIPAMEQVVDMGKLAFVPAVAGFWLGILFFFCSTISSRICTATARGRRDRKAS